MLDTFKKKKKKKKKALHTLTYQNFYLGDENI